MIADMAPAATAAAPTVVEAIAPAATSAAAVAVSPTDTATTAAAMAVAVDRLPVATTATAAVAVDRLPAAMAVAPAITAGRAPAWTAAVALATALSSALSGPSFSRSKNSSQQTLQTASSSAPFRLRPTHPSLHCERREQTSDPLQIFHSILAGCKFSPFLFPY